MKKLLILTAIGMAGGLLLSAFLEAVHVLTGSSAYVILYNVDYIPYISKLNDFPGFGLLFHFTFCIASVIGLYYILRFFGMHHRIFPYLIVYTAGSGVLYFLTALTEQPPAATDLQSWFYWTFSHLLYALAVSYLIRFYFVRRQPVPVNELKKLHGS